MRYFPRKTLQLIFASCALLPCALWAEAALSVRALVCDGAADPKGIDTPSPRLSWKLDSETRGQKQTAYQILVASDRQHLDKDRGDLWDSGKVDSDETAFVPYAGLGLKSSQQVFWKVRAWDKDGKPTAWSSPATWTMGLNPEDWKRGSWIAAKGASESLLMRKDFSIKPGLKRAVAHVTGLGHYVFYLNGKPVGDKLFAPGWTDYDKTVEYETVDVTAYLKAGENAAGLFLGNGFYNVVHRDRFSKLKGSYGPLRAILHIFIEYEDGSRDFFRTDASWRTKAGPVTAGNIFAGEDFDARLWPQGWNMPGFDSEGWTWAVELRRPTGTLTGHSMSGLPVRANDTHKVVSSKTFSDGSIVYDFGQNASHMPRLKVSGPKGSVVRLTPAEKTNEDGTINRASMDSKYRGNAWWQYTKATDDPEEFSAYFYFVGCRYVKAEFFRNEDELPLRVGPEDHKSKSTPAAAPRKGDPRRLPKIDDIELVSVHADMQRVGEFETSDPFLNKVLDLVRWAKRSNLMSVVMDCNAREKLGWIEAAHLTGPSVRYEYDASRLYAKTVHDILETQGENGRVACIAPEYTVFDRFYSAPEWGAAFLILPWQQYIYDGDTELMRAYYPHMKKYVDWLCANLADGVPTIGANAGDWGDVNPANYNDSGSSRNTPGEITGSAFVYQDVVLLSKMAALIGQDEDARAYGTLAETLRAHYRKNFRDAATGVYGTGSQAANAITAVIGLSNPDELPVLTALIVKDLEKHVYMGTAGNIGHAFVLNALTQGGRADAVLKMIRQKERPGYAYIMERGETSMPETWSANPTSSLNHIMLTHVTEWFYRHLAGISPDAASPGFKHFFICPQITMDGPERVRASYDSVRGMIGVEWRKDNAGNISLFLRVPANTSATVSLPTNAPDSVRESGIAPELSAGVRFVRKDANRCVYKVQSGLYTFTFPLARN